MAIDLFEEFQKEQNAKKISEAEAIVENATNDILDDTDLSDILL